MKKNRRELNKRTYIRVDKINCHIVRVNNQQN